MSAATISTTEPAVSVTISRQRGEEGVPALVNAAGGDFRVQLFFQLVRGCSAGRVRALVAAVLADAERLQSPQHVQDLFLIAFQTRNCRGGKGEKRLFYLLLRELLEFYPQTCLRVAELVPQYGYWKDLFAIAAFLQAELADAQAAEDSAAAGAKEETTSDAAAGAKPETASAPIADVPHCGSAANASTLEKLLRQWIELVVFLCVRTLGADQATLKASDAAATGAVEEGARGNGLTLLAKYFPNELTAKKRRKRKAALDTGGANGWALTEAQVLATQPIKWFNLVADRLCGVSQGRKELRQLITALRTRLNVTESLMSARRWGDIDVGKVASLCLLRQRKALERHCAESLGRAIQQKRVNSVQLFPHEIAQKLLDDLDAAYLCEVLGEPVAVLLSTEAKALFEVQWEKLRENVRAKMLAKLSDATHDAEGGGDAGEAVTAKKHLPAVPLTNIVPIVDMSGSMHGTPVAVAVAFGILLSELVECPHFHNRVLTFATQPEWFEFDPTTHTTLLSKVRAIRSIQDRCGESTNVRLAFERVLEVAVAQGLTQAQLPELVVLSDMQFTDASAGTTWATEYEATRAKFAAAGYEVPLLTFWNLRSVDAAADGGAGGETGSVPVAASMPGVRLLSGFSPHLMKQLLNGEFVEEEVPSDDDEPIDDIEEVGGEVALEGEAAVLDDWQVVDATDAGVVAVDEGGEAKTPDAVDAAAVTAPALPRARRVNPLATLRQTLDDAAYDNVRTVLASMAEKLLQPQASGAALAVPAK